MASSLRNTFLLARTVRPFTRAYTTTLPLRAAQRVNPLIGASPIPSATQTAEKPSKVAEKVEKSSPVSDIPPPPPPPEQSATPAATPAAAEQPSSATETTKPAEKDRAYDALSFDIASIIGKKSAAYAESLGRNDPMTRPKVRTKAPTGRTVFIKDRLSPNSAPNASTAFRVLDRMCKDQKIRNKYHSQKFHERPGLKRKRLKSQRWRARFKIGFKATVSRVLELKKQGW